MIQGSTSDQSGQKDRGTHTGIEEANAPVLSGEFKAPVTIQYSHEPGKLQIPHQIPSSPLDFTGRDEELQDLLASFDRGATITGLRGMGGIGKTALAYALAEKLASRYPGGQILVELRGTSPDHMKSAEAMGRVIRAYHQEAKLPESEADLAGIYRSVLYSKHALLLLDNAADRKQVEPLMPPKGCAVIVTSRKKFTLPGMPEPFLLDTLKPFEARDLLLKICPRVGDHSDELAKLCGYLPLALRASASLLAVKSDLNPGSYLEELRLERTRLEKIGKEGVDLDVEASFNLSYSRLPAEMASVFCKLSIFSSDFDAAAEEAICQDQGHAQLSNLVTWSLVEFQQETGRYSLHDLARIFAASRLEAAIKTEAQQRHAEHYKNALSALDELYLKGGNGVLAAMQLFDLEEVNIMAGHAWAEKNLEANSSAAELCRSYPDAGVYVLDLRLHPRQKISWLESGVGAARRLKDRAAEGVHLGNLGLAYAVLGDAKKAIEFYEQRLVIAREIGDRRGEGNALWNMSLSLDKLGQRAEAIDYAKSALKIYEQIESPTAERVRRTLAEWQK